MKLDTALRHFEQKLAKAGIDSPALDTHLLVLHALKLDRAEIMSHPERVLSADEIRTLENLIARRAAHEPVARIQGKREFWSLPFKLNEATLEPRPDSETLVEVALKQLRTSFPRKREESSCERPRARDSSAADAAGLDSRFRGNDVSILDLGTGTGCLLLALLHELPDATGLGIDIAPRAVEQGTTNAKNLGLSARASFKIGNWFEDITDKFDAIVSNPPYIPAGDIPSLMPEVREHDPMQALDGGKDGLGIYRLLIPQLSQFLKPKGFAIFEVGMGQADDVAALCHRAGFVDISKYKDLNGIERCVAVKVI